MKTAIVYSSTHHENTKKLIDAIAKEYDVTLLNADTANTADLSPYDLIGFASGIAWSKFYDTISQFAQNCLPPQKDVFFIYTCDSNSRDFSIEMQKIAEAKGSKVLGTYGCKGYDTFGPFKLIGGINKKHPTEDEIKGAVDFFKSLIK